MGFFKQAVRAILKLFGLKLHWIRPVASSLPPIQMAATQMVASLQKFEINLILDVGANQGQFASEIRQCGYAGRIVSFEPLSKAHDKLIQASDGDTKWEVYPRCALGDHNGEVEINIAGNSESSSILPML